MEQQTEFQTFNDALGLKVNQAVQQLEQDVTRVIRLLVSEQLSGECADADRMRKTRSYQVLLGVQAELEALAEQTKPEVKSRL